ncbi:collagenase-like [Toxorhynchites rutilus septentrionalis]|uniref:collagenase-like n=1 Tax=Toxorhynchites rutilus septentrionalis TaxID=329112 RepID=UPI0024787AA4|nr:collagenase-like [Toxorhynchites rutilus septentrionalis]XP_055619898.1 collagenase-like [Toxorhynchites rutilus septentrionalis]XP_055619899.1 collagenase-like [Toxorhynchites rutilus septentrionalis]
MILLYVLVVACLIAFAVSESPGQPRIINGKDAELGQFPYQAMLKIATPRGNALCGGSLLSDEWVLTAGHCVENASSFEVTLGAVDFKDQGNDERVVMNSTEYTRHEQYQAGSATNDIALIRLPQKVQLSDRIQPVKLPSGHDDYNRRQAIVSGWGKENDWGGAADKLQYTQLTVIRNTECKLFYGMSTIKPTTLCCKGDTQQSTCNGDSGGPLVLKDDKTLIGVVSFGHVIGCQKMLPVAFGRVTEFADWIREKTGIPAQEGDS